MAKTSYYAVKNGKNPGVYTTWSDCEAQVKGFPGAMYKKFSSYDEANEYISPEEGIKPAVANEVADTVSDAEMSSYRFDGSIKIKSGRFVNFRDPNSDLVEYYKMPYEDKNGKGNIFVRECGTIFIAEDGVDHKYEYGNPVDDICATKLRPCIEDAAGYDFDTIIETARERKAMDKRKIEKSSGGPSEISDRNVVTVYVDGSFNADTKEYGYGAYISDGVNKQILYGHDMQREGGRNVEGEVAASRAALDMLSKNSKYNNVVLYHDYQGIGSWADKDWKANKTYTREYAEFVQGLRDKGMNITFKHVDGHTGVEGNEYVDVIAKLACGVPVSEKDKRFLSNLSSAHGYNQLMNHADNIADSKDELASIGVTEDYGLF